MFNTETVAFEELASWRDPITAPQDQREGVLVLLDLFKRVATERADFASYKIISPTGETAEIPKLVFLFLKRIVEVFARGDAITVVPVRKELTVQQAANNLHVSRRYLVQLLEEGRIPFRKTGTHKRVQIEDILAFKRQRDRMASLDKLSQLSQGFGGYEEIP